MDQLSMVKIPVMEDLHRQLDSLQAEFASMDVHRRSGKARTQTAGSGRNVQPQRQLRPQIVHIQPVAVDVPLSLIHI